MHPYPREPLSLLLICLAAVPLGAQAPRGVQLFDAGDWAGAKTESAATIRRNDRDARAYYYRGRLAMLDDDADAAAAQFERAVALDETIADYHLWYGAALSQQAGRASKLKQPFLAKRVMSEFERTVALDDPYGPYGIGRIVALAGRRLDRGEKGIRAFIAKPPKDAGALVLSGAWRRLGLVLECQGKRAESQRAIKQALTLDPRNEEAKKALS